MCSGSYYVHCRVLLWDGSAGSFSFIGWRLHHHYHCVQALVSCYSQTGPICKLSPAQRGLTAPIEPQVTGTIQVITSKEKVRAVQVSGERLYEGIVCTVIFYRNICTEPKHQSNDLSSQNCFQTYTDKVVSCNCNAYIITRLFLYFKYI